MHDATTDITTDVNELLIYELQRTRTTIQKFMDTYPATHEAINRIADAHDAKYVSLREACRQLKIEYPVLRRLVEEGVITGVLLTPNPHKKHYRVNIAQARRELVENGYLERALKETLTPKPIHHV